MEKKKSRLRSKYVKLSLSLFAAGVGILLCYYLLYNTENQKTSEKREAG